LIEGELADGTGEESGALPHGSEAGS
jgi:hypothetical protein